MKKLLSISTLGLMLAAPAVMATGEPSTHLTYKTNPGSCYHQCNCAQAGGQKSGKAPCITYDKTGYEGKAYPTTCAEACPAQTQQIEGSNTDPNNSSDEYMPIE